MAPLCLLNSSPPVRTHSTHSSTSTTPELTSRARRRRGSMTCPACLRAPGPAAGVETSREISNTAMPAGGWVAWKPLGLWSRTSLDPHALAPRVTSMQVRHAGSRTVASVTAAAREGWRLPFQECCRGSPAPGGRCDGERPGQPCHHHASLRRHRRLVRRVPNDAGTLADETVLTGANASPCVLALAGGECQHTWREPVPPLTKRKRAHGFQTVA